MSTSSPITISPCRVSILLPLPPAPWISQMAPGKMAPLSFAQVNGESLRCKPLAWALTAAGGWHTNLKRESGNVTKSMCFRAVTIQRMYFIID